MKLSPPTREFALKFPVTGTMHLEFPMHKEKCSMEKQFSHKTFFTLQNCVTTISEELHVICQRITQFIFMDYVIIAKSRLIIERLIAV